MSVVRDGEVTFPPPAISVSAAPKKEAAAAPVAKEAKKPSKLKYWLAAADRVGLTQPGASKALKELESTLNAPLFMRTNRGLVPTEAGTCAVRFARLIQSDISHLQQELSAIASGAGGRIAVGTIMGAVPLLTRALTQLMDQQPDISVEIVEDTSESLLALIDQGRLDAAICRSSVSPKPHLYDTVVVKDESLAVIAHQAHPAAGLASITLQDLSASRWVVYRAHMPMRRTLEREFFEENLFFPTHLIETTSALATLSLLSHNPNLVALVSDDVADYVCQHGMVARLPLRLVQWGGVAGVLDHFQAGIA